MNHAREWMEVSPRILLGTKIMGVSVILALIGAIVGLFVLWMAANAILLIFAGVLFGVLLDACVRAAAYALPLSRPWRLSLVCALIVGLLVPAVWWASVFLRQEIERLYRLINEQIVYLLDRVKELGLPVAGDLGDGDSLFGLLIGEAGTVLGHATTALSLGMGVLVNIVIIAIAGIFLAASPASYRDGIVRLFPLSQRSSLRNILDEIGAVLRWWLAGQLVAMVLIGVSVATALWLLGVPGALLLGAQAGVLGFIPYLGPIVAAIPIALAAMPMGMFWLAVILSLYSAIQLIEGYLLTPLIHQQAVSLPPLLTLSSLLVMGALFGLPGIILSTPLVAAGRVIVLRLYVERWLESEATTTDPIQRDP